MKSNVPWSIKGIDPDARVVAKKAAREAGMTLGEWLNQQIMTYGDEPDGDEEAAANDDTGAGVQSLPTNVVTVDQLREVVFSLNRLNDRLKATEQNSVQAFSGLNQGLSSVLERVRRVEEERTTGADPELLTRLEKIENDDGPRKYLDSFVALEKALQHMVDEFDATRDETISRVSATEEAISQLDTRVRTIDEKSAEALTQLRGHIDHVTDQLKKTEATSRALMMEAKAAAQSDDEEFIERTSQKLRILGTEIKRSGDQIHSLENNIQKLSEKIEGAEQRSAEGINRLSGTIEKLRTELTEYDQEQADATRQTHSVIAETTKAAQDRINDLQGSFEKMVNRLQGVADGEQAYQEMTAAAQLAQPPQPTASKSPLSQAMEEAEGELPDTDDFDEVFGEALDESEAEERKVAPPPPEDLPAEETETALKTRDVLDEVTADPDLAADKDGEKRRLPLTAKQKVILAARARRKRLEKEAQAETPIETPAEISADDEDEELSGKSKISQLREKYAKREGGSNLPLIAALGLGLVVVAGLGFMLLRGGNTDTVSAITPTPTETATTPGSETGVAGIPPQTEATPQEQFRRFETLSQTATSEEERNRALIILKGAANRDYPPAQYALGEAYRTGSFGEQNAIFARNWFQAAAEGGNVDAMHKLGSMYAQGLGGPQNPSTSISWFEQAASYGYVDSIYNLALIYDPTVELENSATQSKDAEQAYYWYGLAAKLGDRDASNDAVRLSVMLSAEQRQAVDAQVQSWEARLPLASAN